MELAKKHRYPGLKPFSVDEQNIFFGRDEDIKRLCRSITLERQVLLYAKSGLGKSSLMSAGVTPQLLAEGNLIPVRIRFGAYRPGSSMPLDEVLTHQADLPERTSSFLDKVGAAQDSLWYRFKSGQIGAEKDRPFLLILDQFEEVFTYPARELARFRRELANLLHNVIPKEFRDVLEARLQEDPGFFTDEELGMAYDPLDIKAVYVIRSDKLSLMDQFKDVLPEILSRTYHLGALNRLQAEEAIINPAYERSEGFSSPRFDYSDEALDAMLDFLTKDGEQAVESFQLQVVCQYAETLVLAKGKKTIDREDLGEIGDIFENYYESLIAQLGDESRQNKARKLIEEGLILEEDELRLSLHKGQISRDYDIDDALLDQLVSTRLMREEPTVRGGSVYEISHDTLIVPILKAKRRRQQKEKETESIARREAEAAALKEERDTARRRTRMALVTTALGVVLSIGLMALTAWAFQQKDEAVRASERAKKATDYAMALKKESEIRAERLDSLFNVIQDLTARGEIETSNEAKLDKVLQERRRVDIEYQKGNDLIKNPTEEDKPIKPQPNPEDKVPSDDLIPKNPDGKPIDVSVDLEKAYKQMFTGNEVERRTALNQVIRESQSNEKVTGELINYTLKNLENEDGIYYTLYILDQMPKDQIRKNRRQVYALLEKLRSRDTSLRNQKRMRSILTKIR